MKPEHKKYILENFPDKSVHKIAKDLNIKERKVEKFLGKAKEKGLLKPQAEEKKKTKKIHVFLACLLIVILTFSVYANSISGEFILDDNLLIVDNTYVKSWIHVPKLFTEDMGSGIGLRSSYYRPLQALTYLINYHFWKLNVQPYHVVNILLHIMAALAVYWMINILFNSRTLSLFTALLFAVHPIHPESVAYISGRGDCMVGLFAVLAFIFYVKQLGTNSVMVYVLLFASYVLALFAKEQSLMLPALFLLYHYVFKKKIKVFPFAALVVVTFVYLFSRVSLLKEPASNISLIAIIQRIPGFFVAMTGYMRILFMPFNLHMGYDMRVFPLTDPRAILGGVIIVSLLWYALKMKKRSPLVFFSIFWFFITLLPVSNLYPLSFYMADHYLYLPSIGFFLILASVLSHFYKVRTFRMHSVAVLVVLTAAYSYLTVRQNEYWIDAKFFYERTLRFNPKSPRMYSNLAKEYVRWKNYEKAIELYKKAVEINPGFVNAHYNLGATYNQVGRKEEAIAACKRAIELDPTYTHAYNIVGAVYWDLGENDKAMEFFQKAVSLSPSNVIALCNLAASYEKAGRREEALATLNKTMKADPDYGLAYANMGAIYASMDRREEAVAMFEKALALGIVKPANTYNNLGKTYYELGREKEAVEAFKKALEIDPDNENARSNLFMIHSYEKDSEKQ